MTALRDSYPLYLANEAQTPNLDLEVTDKYTGKVATRVALANAAIIDAGIAATVEAAEPMARMPAYARQEVLAHCVKRFQERFEELAYALCIEAGRIEKAPLGWSVSASTSPMMMAPSGVREAGFITNGQPTAIAGAILWAARFSGKLKGLMNEQGPIGTRFHMP